MTGETQYSTH